MLKNIVRQSLGKGGVALRQTQLAPRAQLVATSPYSPCAMVLGSKV